jgi:hypothetical protein
MYVAAFVAIALAATQDRPTSSLALIFIAIAGLMWASRRAASLHDSTGERRFSRTQLVMAWMGIVIAIAIVFAVAPTRRIAIYDVLGFKRIARLTITATRVLEGHHGYEVIVTVDNPTRTEHFVTNVGLAVTTEGRPGGGTLGCLATPYRFRVAQTLTVSHRGPGRGGIAIPTVTESKGATFRETADGLVSGYCARQTVTVGFTAGVPLPAERYSEIAIELPHEFKVIHDESPRSSVGRARVQTLATVALAPDGQTSGTQEQVAGYVAVEFAIAGQKGSIWSCHTASLPWLNNNLDTCHGVVAPSRAISATHS